MVKQAGSITISFSIVLALTGLAGTTAAVQHKSGAVSETVATIVDRDVNGADLVIQKVVTRRSPTKDGEEVVTETYRPSIDVGRLALSQRIRRLTTVTADGSETVEETEERSRCCPHEPMQVARRRVTTVRSDGPNAYVTETRVFERDLAGRFALVQTEIERTSGK